jgi:hypothetical protein
MRVPTKRTAMLGTHVIDEGAHARKKHDARPPVICGRRDNCILETNNLQLEQY